jgi:biopolymer transport protein ExbD
MIVPDLEPDSAPEEHTPIEESPSPQDFPPEESPPVEASLASEAPRYPFEDQLAPTPPVVEEQISTPGPLTRRPPPRQMPAKKQTYREAEAETPLVPPMMKIDFEDLIDMTAMVDIVFFLLIFFLVTSMNALDSTIPLPAPTPQAGSSGGAGSTPTSVDGEDSSITVNIDRNDTIRIDGVEVTGQRDLLFKLRDLKNGPGRPEKLLVVGSSDASHGVAVMVLDAGHEVGMESVQMAVRDDNE